MRKLAIICILLACVAAMLVPCLAAAAELDEYGSGYNLLFNNADGYYVELYGLGVEFSFPIQDVITLMRYSDSETAISSLRCTAKLTTYYEYDDTYVSTAAQTTSGNANSLTLTAYSDYPENQDALASVTISWYQSPDEPGYYAYSIEFENIAGTESIDYETSLTFSFTRIEVAIYNDGYEDGYNTGYSTGYESGYQDGLSHADEAAYENGYIDGRSDGYSTGYDEGFLDGESSIPGGTGVAKSLFGVVLDIISTPILGVISVADILLIIVILGLVGFVVHWIRG